MRVFVTGHAGQLGRDISAMLTTRGHAVSGADLPELDIADSASTAAVLDAFQPEALVNCAAFTHVDACETRQEESFRANALGPGVLARYAAARGLFLVHVSTDYIFPGDRPPPEPYFETDEPGPVSVYGRGKLAGEWAVAAAGGRWAICRTAWLYGAHGRNFLRTMLRLAQANPQSPLRVVNDQFGSPTCSSRLAAQICAMLERQAQGLFHTTSEGYCTWHDLATRFLELLDMPGLVVPCASTEYPTPAKRPGNSILENARLKSAGMNLFCDWREELERFVAEVARPIWLREITHTKMEHD